MRSKHSKSACKFNKPYWTKITKILTNPSHPLTSTSVSSFQVSRFTNKPYKRSKQVLTTFNAIEKSMDRKLNKSNKLKSNTWLCSLTLISLLSINIFNIPNSLSGSIKCLSNWPRNSLIWVSKTKPYLHLKSSKLKNDFFSLFYSLFITKHSLTPKLSQ